MKGVRNKKRETERERELEEGECERVEGGSVGGDE